MHKNNLFSRNRNNGTRGMTYINGLGFVDTNQSKTMFSLIRGSSNIVCFCTLLFFFLQKAFILPTTYFVYFLGANIQINYLTGLIVSTPFSRTTILFLANFAALFISAFLCFIANRRQISCAKIFKLPYNDITSLSCPITITVGLLGMVLGLLASKLFAAWGLIFTASLPPITSLAPLTFYALFFGILLAILEEVFFRGIILTSLRQFGDGFAIIATSILFALWSGGIAEFILYFFLSLPLCYFTIRSGSIYTPIINRVLFKLIVFAFSLALGTLEQSLSLVIILLSSILIFLFAGYAFVTFIKTDRKAFYLRPAKDKLSLSVKISMFSSGIVFILLVCFQLIRIVESTQIIG
ncbi:MAG: CPBP family intramembrane glutamic endopeptidase [Oscillospiraceae bacterium]